MSTGAADTGTATGTGVRLPSPLRTHRATGAVRPVRPRPPSARWRWRRVEDWLKDGILPHAGVSGTGNIPYSTCLSGMGVFAAQPLDRPGHSEDHMDMNSGGEPDDDRVSERDRTRVARRLRRALRQGRISSETFAWRLDRTLAARYRHELAALVDDQPPGRLGRAWAAVVDTCQRAGDDLRAAFHREPRIDLLLPPPGSAPVVVGRAPGCDLVLAREQTVSARHAELVAVQNGWMVRDLRSTNGTWLNGARIASIAPVRPGDTLWFGSTRFALIAPTPTPYPQLRTMPPRPTPVIPGPEPVTPRVPLRPYRPALPHHP